MEDMIRFTAERLLGRKLKKTDGINPVLLQEVEDRLLVKIPAILQTFYTLVGNNHLLTASFQRFLKVTDLYCDNNKLVFLEENQGVCEWGIAVTDPDGDQAMVYQCPYVPTERVWYSEETTLFDFMQLNMYYQFAQGGYENVASLDTGIYDAEITTVLTKVAPTWEKVVDHRGNLVIYWDKGKLLWYFPDKEGNVSESLYLSTKTKKDMHQMVVSYDFCEL